MGSNKLVIKRHLAAKKAVTESVCAPGKITVLIDEAGDGALVAYKAALFGKKTEERFQFLLNDEPFVPTPEILVGLDQKLNDKMKIPEFLEHAGYSAAEADALLDRYDLRDVSYLSCGQLNATATMQLLLLRAMKNQSPVIIMDDPFLPFSGRWREHFGEKILEFTKNSDRILLVTNLSFVPQTWAKHDLISFCDVGKAADRAVRRAEQMAKIEELAALAEKAAASQPAAKTPEKEGEKPVPGMLPSTLNFAYKATADYIFDPLARLSNGVRQFSGFAMPAGILGVCAIVAAVMYPDMDYYQAKFKQVVAMIQDNPNPPPAIQSDIPEGHQASFRKESDEDNSAAASPDPREDTDTSVTEVNLGTEAGKSDRTVQAEDSALLLDEDPTADPESGVAAFPTTPTPIPQCLPLDTPLCVGSEVPACPSIELVLSTSSSS